MGITELRKLPSVDELLQFPRINQLAAKHGRNLTIDSIRTTLDETRNQVKKGGLRPDDLTLCLTIEELLNSWLAPTFLPVINATGVILHTNLGRAPLSLKALQAIQETASGYSTLEYDLEKGIRGSRHVHTEALLTRLTGAEAAMVVNNNAAAVLLCLTALARRRRVVISRSQLVEIGGGFRVPDVMKQSGAILVEVGTTNRTHVSDYEEALQHPTALLMRAHQSNFKIIGFTSEPTLKEMAILARKNNVILLDDLGSGCFLDTDNFGLAHEPTVQESIADGADLVCFSGDKLLGGPQSGIILGRADLVAKLKKHPLARAIRADKLSLAALSATLISYLENRAIEEIPIWQMISISPNQVKARAQKWVEKSGIGEVIASKSTVGGGSLPEETLDTYVMAIKAKNLNEKLNRLRQFSSAVIARLSDDRVVFDPRTVFPGQEEDLIRCIKSVFGGNKKE